MKKIRYDGTDFSGTWKIVTFEGKTVEARWGVETDSKTKEVFVVSRPNSQSRPVVGLSNYRLIAQAALMFGGVPVRE